MPAGNHNTKQATLDKQEAREDWYKIVLKILRWKEDVLSNDIQKPTEKVSHQEWKIYTETVLSMNVTNGKAQTQQRLEEIKKAIEDQDGFERL